MRRDNYSLGKLRRSLPWLLFLLLSATLFAASPTPLPAPKPAGSLFQERPFGPLPPPTEAPARRYDPEAEKPIPREYIIGGIAAAILLAGLILWGSARAWRSSNFFDQQYRFPANRNAILRLGGPRCGGHMAMLGGSSKSPNE